MNINIQRDSYLLEALAWKRCRDCINITSLHLIPGNFEANQIMQYLGSKRKQQESSFYYCAVNTFSTWKLVNPCCGFHICLYARPPPANQSLHCNGTHLTRCAWLSAMLLFVLCAAPQRDVMCEKTRQRSWLICTKD